jgi:hypothetical protein
MELARMNYLIKAFIWFVVAGILLFICCDRKPRRGTTYTSWKSQSMHRKIPGIDNGSAYFGGYKEGTAIIVWTNSMSCKLKIKDSWNKTRKCVKYGGHIETISRKTINIVCYVEERMKGSVTINGQEYDLANGSLFLIDLRTAQIKVGQIEQDIYEITPKTRRQLAEDVPEIKAFFESSADE